MNGEQQPISDTLLMTLHQMVREFGETYIILDALDECKNREELLEGLGEIVSWELKKLHILVTSRREKDIEQPLESLVNDENRACIQSTLVNDDIRAYIHKRLQTDQKLKRWRKNSKAQQEIETTLMGKADGM
jgi:hypothetical protein